MLKLQDHLEEVEARLREEAKTVDPKKREERARFMKTFMPMLGLTVPQQRAVLKKGYSFSNLAPRDQLPIWDHVWRHAGLHEAKLQAVFFLNGKGASLPFETVWPVTREWAESLNCWDQSDELSKHYSRLLEEEPDVVLPVLQSWNTDANPWKRRQSLVSLLFYARSRRWAPPVSEILALAEARLGDEDHYVQKGLGWCLRECFQVYPEETLAFLEEHVRDLTPVAFSAATEKLGQEQKAKLKALRRKGR